MAMETKWTKGPWKREPDHPVTGYADIDDHIVGADGCTVADCYGPRELQPQRTNLPLAEQCRSNAHLIASAPELYEALDEVMALLRKEAPGTPLNNHRFDALGMKAHAALAKACGES